MRTAVSSELLATVLSVKRTYNFETVEEQLPRRIGEYSAYQSREGRVLFLHPFTVAGTSGGSVDCQCAGLRRWIGIDNDCNDESDYPCSPDSTKVPITSASKASRHRVSSVQHVCRS